MADYSDLGFQPASQEAYRDIGFQADSQPSPPHSDLGFVPGKSAPEQQSPASSPTFNAAPKLPWYHELLNRFVDAAAGPGSVISGLLNNLPGVQHSLDSLGIPAGGESGNFARQQPAAADRPIVNLENLRAEDAIPGDGFVAKAARGLVQGSEGGLNKFATPMNAALLAGTSGLGEAVPVVSRLLSTGFSLSMLKNAFDQSPEFARQVQAGDVQGATKTLTEIGITAAAGVAAAKHGASPKGMLPADLARDVMDKDPAAIKTAQKLAPTEPVTGTENARDLDRLQTPAPQRYPEASSDWQVKEERPANRPSARKTAPKATVPVEGPTDEQQRIADARDRLSQQVTSKSYAELGEHDKLAIDSLAREGYGSVQPEKAAEDNNPPTADISNAPQTNDLAGIPQAAAASDHISEPSAKPAREPQKPVAYGSETDVRVPGENRSYAAVYSVREASDVYPSHNPFSFEPNPDYYHRNDRNYAETRNSERVVKQEAEFDPAFLVNDNPDATNGPPIIDQHGNVLGGNSRTMSLARVRENRPEASGAYRQLVIDQAKRFGIAPQLVDRMENPVLLRQMTGEFDPQQAVTDLNKTGTAALTQAERAISDSKRLSPDTAEYLARQIEQQGPDGTLAQALEGSGGREIVNRLVDDGIFTGQEKPQLLNGDGSMTPEGKQRVGRLLSGQFFNSARELEETAPEVRAKLDRIVPSVMRTAQREGWDLTEPVKEAVSLLKDAKARGVPVDDIVRQEGLFGGGGYSDDAVAIARTMEGKPTAIARAFRQYASDEAMSRPGSPMTMGFEPPAREEAFDSAFGTKAETGERGPILREFRHDEAGATAALKKAENGEAIGALKDKKFGHGDVDLVWGYRGERPPEWKGGFGLAHILAKHPWLEGHLQEMLDRMTRSAPHGPERVDLSNDQGEHAVLALTWFGREKKTWLLTEYDKPGSERILDGSGNPSYEGIGEPTSPPPGASSMKEATAKQKGEPSPGAPRAGIIAPKGGAPSRFRDILDRTREWIRSFGKTERGEPNFSASGAIESKYVRNLGQLEDASPKAWEAAVRAAGSKGQAAVVMRGAVPRILADLKGSGVNWDMFRSALVESRLRGVRMRWRELADAVENSSDTDLKKDLPNYASLIENIEGRRGIAEDARQKAEALLDKGKLDELRAFVADRFNEAADRVGTVMPPRVNFNDVAGNPGFQKALATYKELIEKPMAEGHALNEGVFSDALGPLDAYYPLVPAEEEGKPSFQTGRSTPYRKPRNISNAFATGLGEQYDLGAKALLDRLSTALRMNNRAGLIQTLQDEGLARPLGKFERSGDTINIGGRDFAARVVETGADRQVIRNGKMSYVPADRALLPDWLAKELEPILEKKRIASPSLVRGILDRVNAFALAGPTDAVFHSTNILGSLVANTPYLGKGFLEKTIGNTPITKLFTAAVKIATTDATTPEALQDLAEMAKKGMLGDRYARETYSKAFAEQTGAEVKRFTLGPLLNGPKGLDVRARLVMYRLAKAINPNGTPAEQFKFVSQLGSYVGDLQGSVERSMKSTGFSPFYTAGSTMLRNGINAWTGQGPMPAKGAGLRIAQQLSGGAAGVIGMWAITYRASTGKWPWEDERAKFLEIPVARSIRASAFGKSMWGHDLGKDGYVRFAYFDPIVERGSRALGVEGAANALLRGGGAGQAMEHGLSDSMNSFASPVTTGPGTKAGFILATGREPGISSLRDRYTGEFGPEFYPATAAAPAGLPALAGRAAEAAINTNSFFQNASAAAGFGHKSGQKSDTKGDAALRMIMDLAFPRLLSTAYSAEQHATALEREQGAIDRAVRKAR
jgi:hypothetical protein